MEETNMKMYYKAIAKKLIELRNCDLDLREELIQKSQLGDGYNIKMEELHNKNTQILSDIINTIGYPTIEKVGEEASEAAWLVIQHSIGQPEFMKHCKILLEEVVDKNKAVSRNLAFLTDRIAALEGKPQIYGTQFDWDEKGELNPKQIDDFVNVNLRRRSSGLNTIDEQTVILREQAKKEKHNPPTDYQKRKENLNAWRKAVGWIK